MRFCFIFKFDLDVHQGDTLVVEKAAAGWTILGKAGGVHTVQVRAGVLVGWAFVTKHIWKS